MSNVIMKFHREGYRMCTLCNNIQSGLNSTNNYDKKEMESIRYSLYLKFDDNSYILDRDDYMQIIKLFSFKKVKWHLKIMTDAAELYVNGCSNMKLS